MTKQLQFLLALKALVQAAVPAATVIGFDGDSTVPTQVPADGLIIGLESDPGEPEVDLSPLTYNYSHGVPIDLAAPAGAGGEMLDAWLAAIGAGVRADRTLGGLCNWLEASAPIRRDRTEDDVTVNWAEIEITGDYSTSDPLG